jgi:hypothetical protein
MLYSCTDVLTVADELKPVLWPRGPFPTAAASPITSESRITPHPFLAFQPQAQPQPLLEPPPFKQPQYLLYPRLSRVNLYPCCRSANPDPPSDSFRCGLGLGSGSWFKSSIVFYCTEMSKHLRATSLLPVPVPMCYLYNVHVSVNVGV